MGTIKVGELLKQVVVGYIFSQGLQYYVVVEQTEDSLKVAPLSSEVNGDIRDNLLTLSDSDISVVAVSQSYYRNFPPFQRRWAAIIAEFPMVEKNR